MVDYEVRPEAVVVQAKGEVDSSTAGALISRLGAALQQARRRIRGCSSSICRL